MATTKSYSNKKGTRSAHYTDGKKVLSSHQGSNGRVKHYDGNGRYLGSTREGGYGHVHHYDENGRRTGTTYIKPSGSVRHSPVNTRSYYFDSENTESNSFRHSSSTHYAPSYQSRTISQQTSTKPKQAAESKIKTYPASTYVTCILTGCIIGFILGSLLAFIYNSL